MDDNVWPVVIAALSGLLGAFIGGAVPAWYNRKNALLDRQLKYAELDKTSSYRLGDALARLQSDELGVRMGALFELKKLGLASPEEQENIVRVLGPFIRRGIENQPDDDVFLAAEMTSLFYDQTKQRINLDQLQASGIFLRNIRFQGTILRDAKFLDARLNNANFQDAHLRLANFSDANLSGANFSGADLGCADFQGADLGWADFQKAEFFSTDLRGAKLKWVKNLTAEQLLEAKIDENTQLDPDLRAELDALRAQQDD